MDITFREYERKDKESLLTLIDKLNTYVKSIDPIKRIQNFSGFSELSLEEMLDNIKKYSGKIWLAEDGEKTIGYVAGAIWKQSEKNKLEIGEHKLGEVFDLYVEEEYREKGIGKKMLQMMENYFKDNGCDSMWVEVFTPNEVAHGVYKKYGFADREVGMLKELI